MATSVRELSNERKSALTAGTLLIIMALAAFFSYGFVHRSLVMEGDASTTFNNILSSNGLFDAEILGWIIILIEQIQSLMMLFLEAFEFIWSIGLIFFGGHLLIVGYVALKSDSIPKVISILLLLASIGYIVIHLSKTFLSQYDGVIAILNLVFAIPMIAGELGFGIWLLLRGAKLLKRA
ncbi:hypothetical protein B4V02_25640 [Paenibacillus kribbensis]|uniref:DUF4386 domain-containing protein n=1 Tax=Paenibacillus kribbensis TaxID=172713 RepID=A0A222WVE1_9BACL|nr:DUF4386 domain-containing protein [Paenibacillus kribbensis]ASR49814.1 hypothetical protein B4V02_25640 [Paenibacillus kribbensis]